MSSDPNACPGGPLPRVALGCVTENDPKFMAQAIRWIQSIRWFGGHCAQADVLVCVVERLHAAARRELERWGAKIRVVPRWSASNGSSNRLRLVLLEELRAYDAVAMLDCDTLVVQCPCAELRRPGLAAKPADYDSVAATHLLELYARFGVAAPALQVTTTINRVRMPPYVNAGVVFFGAEALGGFAPRWRKFSDALLADPRWRTHVHVSQAAFALALAEELDGYRELPAAWNFPTHLPLDAIPAELHAVDPVVVHYHARLDARACVAEIGLPAADARIRTFNERHLADRGADARTARFWERRVGDATSREPLGAGCPLPAWLRRVRSALAQNA
jgi:hypothetical protein